MQKEAGRREVYADDKREEYRNPEIEIISLCQKDIITVDSGDELPFIPAGKKINISDF